MEGHRDLFQVVASVRLAPSVEVQAAQDESKSAATGYFRKFGVAALNLELARRAVEEQVQDGALEWFASKITRLSVDEAAALTGGAEALERRLLDTEGADIWYRSGRVFY